MQSGAESGAEQGSGREKKSIRDLELPSIQGKGSVIPVQTADNVQQGGFAGAAGAEDGDEFVITQVQADIVQRILHEIAGLVLFADLFDL